jgi:hypothetical protein
MENIVDKTINLLDDADAEKVDSGLHRARKINSPFVQRFQDPGKSN